MNQFRQLSRSKNIDEDDSVVEVQVPGTRPGADESTSRQAEHNGTEDGIVDQMNEIAGGARRSRQRTPSPAVQSLRQAQRANPRQSPRKRKPEAPIHPSPSKRKRTRVMEEVQVASPVEKKTQGNVTIQSNTKAPRLSRLPRRARDITRRSSQDYEIPPDEEVEAPRLQPTVMPAKQLRKQRDLRSKVNTRSPLEGHGIVQIDVADVNLQETSPAARRGGRPSGRTKAQNEATWEPNGRGQRIATRKSQETPDDDEEDAYVDEAHEDDSEGTSDEDARREAEERAEQRRKALNGVEQAVTLFGRREAWVELFIAGRAIKLKQRSPQPESESGEKALMHITRIKSLFTTSRTESDTPIDLQTVRQRYNKHCRRYHAELEAFKPDSLDTSHERVAQSRDLHQHLIPMLIKACKAALQTLFHGTQPAWAEFDLLAGLLMTTARSVDKAQDWRPRPTSMDNGTLGDMRNKVGKNIRNLHNLFADQAKALKARIDEEELLKKLHRLQAENQARLWQGIRERRARILGRHRRAGNCREPLVDITDRVIDIDDLDLNGNQRSTQSIQSTAVRQTRLWSEPETHALLIAFEQCAGPDALRKINDLNYHDLADISIEDMRQRLQVLKNTLQGVAAARDNSCLRHVLSFPDG